MFIPVFVLRKTWLAILATLALVALIATGLTVNASPARADTAATGSGGLFMPQQGRIYSSANPGNTKMVANQWRTIQVLGQAGLPATGVSAVQVSLAAVNQPAGGILYSAKNSNSTRVQQIIFGSAAVTNTAILPVADNGTVMIMATAETDVIVDLQGYYTAGNTAAGGYVPIDPTQLNTIPGNTSYTSGQSVTFSVGKGGLIPSNASSVVLNVVEFADDTTANGWLNIKPANSPATFQGAQFNWPAGKDYVWTTAVDLPESSNGNVTISVGPRGSIKLAVSVLGYYTAAAGNTAAGMFIPAQSRAKGLTQVVVGKGQTQKVQIAGVNGIPAKSSGITAVAANLALTATLDGGHIEVFASDASPGLTQQSYQAGQNMTTFTVVELGPDGAINIRNSSGKAWVTIEIDVQGWFTGLPTGPADTNLTGSRASATNLSFGISDQTSAQVDVATGNLMLSTVGLSLPGVTSTTPIGASYNSRGSQASSTMTGDANKWTYALSAAGSLSSNAQGVVYTSADGATWQFKPGTVAGSFTSPAGLQQTLARTNTDYTLTGWASRQIIHFDLNGNPISIEDRNKNTTFLNRQGPDLKTIVSTAGTTAARTVTASYADNTQTFTQTSGSSSRNIAYTKNADGNIVTYRDALGGTTTFGYQGTNLTSITASGGGVTSVTYDSSNRVTRISQANTTAGSPGEATTRLAYTSATETLVADANTDQTATVAAAPHTTYTLNSTTNLVTKAVDPAGRVQSATYNAANNGVASKANGEGSSASTSTGTYGANSGQSLTKVQSGTGAASSATYGSTASTAYLPATSTDSSNNTTTYGYDGVGNQMSTATGSGAQAATANLAYNSDGTIKTATAPANTGNPTTYAYDANKQLSTITPPSGTSLGVKTYTYDAFGRVASQTDGRGGTTSFTYDNADRLLTTSFSDGTPTVTNTYDANGNQKTVASATGTITNTHDQQNRLVSTVNTAGGGTTGYGYDKASNVKTVTTGAGTTTHTYDAANVPTSTSYPKGAGTANLVYANDDKGRRTDTWLASNPDHSTWAARTNTTYDGSNRVTAVKAWTGTGNSSNTVTFDTSYCYQAGTTAPTCTTSATSDRDTLQWSRDNLTGQVTTYGYTDGRLTSATQTGGAVNSTWTYSYDKNGNRTGEAITGANPSSQNLTFNAASQITNAGYVYDGAGNLTASPGATYSYNGAQQMTASTKDGVTTDYTYAGADQNQLLTEATVGGASYSYTYGKADGQGVPTIVKQTITGGATSYVTSDPRTGQALGLTTGAGSMGMFLVDGIGNQVGSLTDAGSTAYRVFYAPYGAQTVTSGDTSDHWKQNPYGFKSGNRTDDGTAVKFGFRWYIAATGSWTQRDTLDAPLDPKNANRYAFAGADPINQSDPTGRYTSCESAQQTVKFGLFGYALSTIGAVGTAATGVGIPVAVGIVGALVVEAGAIGAAFDSAARECG